MRRRRWARAYTAGQNVRLWRQVGSIWRRSKRQFAFYLQASPTAYLAARYPRGADDVAAGSSVHLPSPPFVRTWCVTIRRCFLVLPALLTVTVYCEPTGATLTSGVTGMHRSYSRIHRILVLTQLRSSAMSDFPFRPPDHQSEFQYTYTWHSRGLMQKGHLPGEMPSPWGDHTFLPI